MLVLGSLRDGRDPLIAQWAGYIVCFATLSIGFALRGVLPDALVIAGNNALALVTLGLPWLALRRLRGAAAPARWLALLPALWLGACLVPAFYASLPARICLQTALIVFLLLGAGREALCVSRALQLRSARDLGLVLLAWAGLQLWRAFAVLFADAAVGAMITAVASAVLGTAVSFLGLAIARERAARREATAQQAGREEIERLLGGLPAVIFLRAVRPGGQTRLLYRGGDVEVVTGWPAATFRIDSLQPWIDLDAVAPCPLHGPDAAGGGGGDRIPHAPARWAAAAGSARIAGCCRAGRMAAARWWATCSTSPPSAPRRRAPWRSGGSPRSARWRPGWRMSSSSRSRSSPSRPRMPGRRSAGAM